MLVLSTQLIGFSIGGIAKRFLVDPPSMSESRRHDRYHDCLTTVPIVWPASLVNTALFNTLHRTHYAGVGERGGLSRERFFLYAFICSL